tara:strand:+ start:2689 stop:3000 length:312 start_codon:yes stop_codon:yes gene_type:complete
MPLNKYESAQVQRVLKVLLLLGGHELKGLAPGEIAKSLTIPNADITRALNNLMYGGLAEQIGDSGRWRLTTRIPQIAVAMLNNLDRAESKLAETRQRYTREHS